MTFDLTFDGRIGLVLLLIGGKRGRADTMEFILFFDDAGAEFTKANANRREIRAAVAGQLVRFRPEHIHPLEVIDPKSSAKRAAGGFLLFGVVGAALGVLSAQGPTVLFELRGPDGATRKGLVPQAQYPMLRRRSRRCRPTVPATCGDRSRVWPVLPRFCW